jgi:integrase
MPTRRKRLGRPTDIRDRVTVTVYMTRAEALKIDRAAREAHVSIGMGARRGAGGPSLSAPGDHMTDSTKQPKRFHGAGRVYRRGRLFWVAYFRNGTEIRESAKTEDEATAQKYLDKQREAAATPTFVSPQAKRLRFEALCDVLQREHARKGNRASISYRVKRLAETFAGDPALAITTDRIDRYAEARKKDAGARPGTINRELATLRAAFRLAVRKGLLPTMPVVTLLPEDNVREGFIDPPEMIALLAELRALGSPDVADLVEFAYLTCLRRGNVIGALWTWFKLEVDATGAVVGGSLRLPGGATKNKKPLTLALTGPLLALVARRWALRVLTCPFVFHRAGVRIRTFKGPWNAACARVGLPRMLFHDLRRSAARNLRRAGVPEHVIMRLGGWRSPSMFRRYDIVDERDLVEANERYATLLAAAATTPPTIAPLPTTPRRRRIGGPGYEYGQNPDNRRVPGTEPVPASL